jgi:hypothetical protein
VLELAAHAYGVLAQLEIEAHARRGARMQTFGIEDHGGRHRKHPHPTGRLECMIVGREERIARWHLGHEALIQIEAVSTGRGEEEREEARARYDFTDWPNVGAGASLEEQAEVWHQWGRRFLERDGSHRTIASLLRGRENTLIDVTPTDDQAKRANLARIALEVDRLGADSVIFTTEAWMAMAVQEDDPRHRLRARDRTDRVHSLITYAAARDGGSAAFSSAFRMVDGSPVLEEVVPFDADPRQALGPILEVWGRWPAEEK